MNGYKIALLAVFAFNVLTLISQIGKPREPLKPSTAVAVTIVNGGLCALVVLS